MKRRPTNAEDRIFPLHRWHLQRSPAGIWLIVDEAGHQPLKDLDLARRVWNLHLAAAAPILAHQLRRLARRFSFVCREEGTEDYRWNLRYLVDARAALSETIPLHSVTGRPSGRELQLEIELDEAA